MLASPSQIIGGGEGGPGPPSSYAYGTLIRSQTRHPAYVRACRVHYLSRGFVCAKKFFHKLLHTTWHTLHGPSMLASRPILITVKILNIGTYMSEQTV